MTHTCDELGLCQKQFGKPACPQCDEEVFECEVPCRPDPAQQTFPFAPGVIQGDGGQQIVFLGREPFPYSLRECLQIAALVAAIVTVLAFGAGYLVEWLS